MTGFQVPLTFDASAQQNPPPVRLLLADDSRSVRQGICRLLASSSEIELVGEAACFREMLELAESLTPRVVLMDLHMRDDREYTPHQVRSALNHACRLVAMSLWNDQPAKSLAQSFGAVALLDKASLNETLVLAIARLGR